MKYLLAVLFLVSFGLIAGQLVLEGRNSQANSSPQSQRVPVIVELFTSEGCSSCPPADALLKRLEQQQPLGSSEIIALEEHVDYWNSLGWTDSFSSPQFTLRQQQYSAWLRSGGAYTPQMIVDGRAEFVGSRSSQAQKEIEVASRVPKAKIEITPKKSGEAHLQEFTVQVEKLPAATPGDVAEVWLALTESQLHSAVTAGENRGEDLQHASVVRRFQKIGEAKAVGEFSFSGEAIVKLDSNWKRENMRVVAFVQEKKSRRVLAAASTSIVL
jgi:hypothetical protein